MPLLFESESQTKEMVLPHRHKKSSRIILGSCAAALAFASATICIDGHIPKASAITSIVDYPDMDAWNCSQTYGKASWCKGMPASVYSSRRYAYRNCTDGVAYWVQQYTGITLPLLGNALDWDNNAIDNGYSLAPGNSNTVEEGDIVQTDNGTVGHVGFITDISRNPSGVPIAIKVAEMNRSGYGEQTHEWYTQKDQATGFFINGSGDLWRNFIDVNGLGKGLNNTPTGLAMPETSGFGDPRGAIDLVRRVPGGVRMVGWAFDPDTPSTPISVDIYGGDGYATPQNYRAGVYANELNTLVGSTYSVDPYKGFTRDFTTPTGPQRLCTYGINTSPNGTTRRNDCVDITVSGQPIGNLDTAYRVPGGVRYEGWAIDPDTAQPIDVHLFESDTTDPGMFHGGTTALIPRTDLESGLSGSYLNYGPNHGYATTLSLGGTATHHVCAFALNTSGTEGGAQKLGCKDVYVTNSPVGTLEGTDRMPDGTVRVAGWGFDPDVAAQGSIHIYSDTGPNTPQTFLAGTTTIARPDVQAVFPGYDTHRGFAVNVAVPTNRRVCTYVLNADGTPGSNVLLGCGSV